MQELIQSIEQARTAVYEHINKPRYQHDLINSTKKWSQICSAQWVIGDTLLSIRDYSESTFPENAGLKYIYLYGILQSLFIQQDAIMNLAESFDISLSTKPRLKEIRDYRNNSIGHPTKRGFKPPFHYYYISRVSISKYSFSLLSSSEEPGSSSIRDIDLKTCIHDQLTEVQKMMTEIVTILKDFDKEHRMKFNDEQLVNVFPATTGYYFEKISQGIHSPSESNRQFGLQMAQLVKEIYLKFQSKLKIRGELPGNDYLAYDLGEYFYALDQVTDYLSENTRNFTERDARVFAFYLEQTHEKFVRIAAEYDEEYTDSEDCRNATST